MRATSPGTATDTPLKGRCPFRRGVRRRARVSASGWSPAGGCRPPRFAQHAAWQSAYAAGRATGTVGRALGHDGHLGHHELACRVVAAITAATHALLQMGDDTPMRFVPGERHWFGTVAQIELGALGTETATRLFSRPAPHRPRAARRARSRTATTR